MAPSNLSEIVRNNIPDNEVHLVPVIEKELLHYDVLDAMEKLGLLEQVVFHGGTCLRLCYGAQRRSEDLDFAYHGNLDDLDLGRLEAKVNESLMDKFGLKGEIRPPKETIELATAALQRWWMIVDTAPARPDLPSQKLKIELVSVETFTREVRRIQRNYSMLSLSFGNTLAVCETLDEILADKIVSLVNTPPTYVRKRDVWDMMYLLAQPACDRLAAFELVPRKAEIYGCELNPKEIAAAGAERVRDVARSPEFAQEMQRFMPTQAFDELFGTDLKKEFAANELQELYRSLG